MLVREILGNLFQDSTLIGIVVALIGGWLLKKWPQFPNKFIPIATLVVSIVTQFINYFTGQPAIVPVIPAPADSTVALVGTQIATAGLFDSGLLKAVIAAIAQWVLTDKTYETQKKAVDLATGAVKPEKKK